MAEKTEKKNRIKQSLSALVNPVSAKANVKRSHIIQLAAGLLLLVLINLVSSYFFTRFDLTQEKRYSLSASTKHLLKGDKKGEEKLDDVIMIRCYLDGDLPANYKKLRNETRDMLNAFRSYNSNVEYEFVDPNNVKDKKEQQEFYEKLFAKGFSPILIQSQNGGKQQQQYIFPYIEVTYNSRTSIKSLLSTKTGFNEDEVIKSSIQNLEYTLYSSIRSMIQGIKPSIAFLYGQGEPDAAYFLDIIQSLSEQYSVDSVTINGQINALVDRRYSKDDSTDIKFHNKYECLIIAQPEIPFTQKDLYIIDQYIMHGGSVLWLMDPLTASMDSLQSRASTMAVSRLTGAEEVLFYYGARLNNDLVMDLQCVKVPIVTGQYGNGQPQMTFYPWNFFPSVSPSSLSPISDKINPVKLNFVSTIDSVQGNNDIRYTPLLLSSENTRLLNAPVEVSLQMLKQKQEPKLFNQGVKTMGMLMEGKFSSAFRGRLSEEMYTNQMLANREMSDSTAMIVVADGDIIKNDLRNGQVVPLGYDVYNGQMFGNKEFLINCVNYLTGDKDLIPLRNREVIVRKLDMAKADRESTMWQAINLALPLLVIAAMGAVIILVRKNRYIRKANR